MDAHKAVSQRGDQKPRARRVFSVAMAQRALPLVRRVVIDVVRHYHMLVKIQREYQVLVRRGPSEELEQLRDRRQEIADRLTELAEELEMIGCELKDYETGLIDFPAVFDGRLVYLCWKLGEPDVAHWHELTDGYAGRQPLAPMLARFA